MTAPQGPVLRTLQGGLEAARLSDLLRSDALALLAAQRALDLEDQVAGVEHTGQRRCVCAGCWAGFSDVDVGIEAHRLRPLAVKGLLVVDSAQGKTRYRLVSRSWDAERREARVGEVRSAVATAVAMAEQEAMLAAQDDDDDDEDEEWRPPRLPGDFLECIVGLRDIKEEVVWALTAPPPPGMDRRPVSILLVGPPATAKSLFLEEIQRIARTEPFFGGSFTRAGLEDALLRRSPPPPERLCIEELDKCALSESGRNAYSALYMAMEAGVKRDRAFDHARTYKPFAVFATANSTRRIPEPVLSRFRVIRLREYSPKRLFRVIGRMLVEREGIPAEDAWAIAALVAARSGDVRQARHVARMYGGDTDRIPRLVERLEEDEEEEEPAPDPKRWTPAWRR